MIHKSNSCPMYLAENGQWSSTLTPYCNCDIPKISTTEKNQEHIEISGEVLKEALSQVIVAAQFSDLRPELNSVLFNYYVEGLKLVATDSFRLAEKTIAPTQTKNP